MSTANTSPIFQRLGDVSSNAGTSFGAAMTTAAADYTGVSANNIVVFTADATNGSWLERLRFKAIGTNVATVARIYLNNGSVHTTAANNVFYGEVSLPATTASASSGTADVDYPMGFALNAAFAIVVGLGTTVAAGWVCCAIGGPY